MVKISNSSSDSDSVALDSAYDFDFWFSQGHKCPYNSESDSVACENQPLFRRLLSFRFATKHGKLAELVVDK